MYYNHNLRTNLQEWKNRLYRAPYQQFGHQLKYFFNNIDNEKQIKGFMVEACLEFKYENEVFSKITNNIRRGTDLSFTNEVDHAAFCYQFIKFFCASAGDYNLQSKMFFQKRDFEDTKSSIIEEYISPIIYFLHDKLDKSNSTIYLLEKYKRRTEWFTKNDLLTKYLTATKNYEDIFEDDLRLFLFDQGIDYPFSTPKTTSGRADIVGAIDTNNPIVIEIKIVDREKKYGKNRIKDGFSQIVKYTNDFNKDVGYLVIFNTDKTELNFNLGEKNNIFPPMFCFNNKTYFFIVINLNNEQTASKIGTTESIEITQSDLIITTANNV